MNPIAAPKTLRYEPDAGLPVAIEAKSNRRYFYPTNGQVFGPTQTNVIHMTLNANSFLDFSHSYLQFTVQNKSGQALALDHGVPFFSRLQIMSGGQELEDILLVSMGVLMLALIVGVAQGLYFYWGCDGDWLALRLNCNGIKVILGRLAEYQMQILFAAGASTAALLAIGANKVINVILEGAML